MALNRNKLADLIRRLTDVNNPNWLGFPADIGLAATNWANICASYLSDLSTPPPPVADTGLVTGIPSFRVAFLANVMNPTLLDQGLLAMVTSIVTAAQPLGPTTLPIAPPPFASVFGPFGPSGDAVVTSERLATQIDLWVRTATFGVIPVPWA